MHRIQCLTSYTYTFPYIFVRDDGGGADNRQV
jgi:hypothetical protein